MIKLFSLKQQKKDEESAGGNRTGAGGKKASAAQLRIQKGRLVNSTSTGLAGPGCRADWSPLNHRVPGRPGRDQDLETQ